jgi:BirA family transcriptional regulator, biotin operon repressor / biotin---[acetyl-CoA-carboxylase] ligase
MVKSPKNDNDGEQGDLTRGAEFLNRATAAQRRLPVWEEGAQSMGFDGEVQAFGQVGSTMDVARGLCFDRPVLILAREQVHGRGRNGRSWFAAEGALIMTLALKIESDLHPLLAGFSLVVGYEISAVLESVYGAQTFVKWPNDILDSQGRKLSGILLETSMRMAGSELLIGIGLNIIGTPTAVDGVSLRELMPPDRVPPKPYELGGLLAARLCAVLQQYLTDGATSVIDPQQWATRAYGIGRAVELRNPPNEMLVGIFEGISHTGAAQILTKEGLLDCSTGTLRFTSQG